MGVQWIFFPVADVNNNPDNPIINIRSLRRGPEGSRRARERHSSKAPAPIRTIAC